MDTSQRETSHRPGPVARATRRIVSLLRGSTHAIAAGETRLWTASADSDAR